MSKAELKAVNVFIWKMIRDGETEKDLRKGNFLIPNANSPES